MASKTRKFYILNQTVFLLSVLSQNYRYLIAIFMSSDCLFMSKNSKKSDLDKVAKQIGDRILGQVYKGDWGCPPP